MKEKISKIINDFITIDSDAVDLITSKWVLQEYKVQENFIEIGQQNTVVGFLKKGLLRSYYYDDHGNEQTTAFIEENSFFSELKSYKTNLPSERTIEALEASEIYILTNNDITELRKIIADWQQFEIRYFEKIVKEKIEFQRAVTIGSKKEALELFIKLYPQSSKFAPRQYIASFLGMTPYTLSRIK